MSEGNSGNPRNAVFTTALWNGAFALADWELHVQRLAENAKRLRLELPSNMTQQLVDFFEKEKLQQEPSLEPSMLVRIECLRTGEMVIEVRTISFRNEEIDAITLPAPRWSSKVNGTKHGDWKPYREAQELAESVAQTSHSSYMITPLSMLIERCLLSSMMMELHGLQHKKKVESIVSPSIF